MTVFGYYHHNLYCIIWMMMMIIVIISLLFPVVKSGNCLYVLGELRPGDCLVSNNELYKFCLKKDGSICVTNAVGDNRWCAESATSNSQKLVVQEDGNVVAYKNTNLIYWTSQTDGDPVAYLIIQDDAQVVAYGSTGTSYYTCNSFFFFGCSKTTCTNCNVCNNAPSAIPTIAPSVNPTKVPTSPTPAPTTRPTYMPTWLRTTSPSFVPSAVPSFIPSQSPTRTPTNTPSCTPSATPTFSPSLTPTGSPSTVPTATPSLIPSCPPTYIPTVLPSIAPNYLPSTVPTYTSSQMPSATPSYTPTATPSVGPSFDPTLLPSQKVPTVAPTNITTTQPTSFPTILPTAMPADTPSCSTLAPSNMPTGSFATQQPTSSPSSTYVQPSNEPSSSPFLLTTFPSVISGSQPSSYPSLPIGTPSSIPTLQRPLSLAPSFFLLLPTSTPTMKPTTSVSSFTTLTLPSTVPSLQTSLSTSELLPTLTPSLNTLTNLPSSSPSLPPTSMPSFSPYSMTTSPTLSRAPSLLLSDTPSFTPSTQLTSFDPSLLPSVFPSFITNHPSSLKPTISPSLLPTISRSQPPTVLPTLNLSESKVPSVQPTASSVKPSVKPSALLATLSPNTMLPPPTLIQALFADDGTFLVILFDSLTDYGGTAIRFTCNQLFSFYCAASSTCQWMDQKTVHAWIQTNDSCAKVNDEVKLSSSAKIRAHCTESNCNSWPIADLSINRVNITSPVTPVLPQIFLSLPTRISSCSQLLLDIGSSTGSGGRSWSEVQVAVKSSNLSENLKPLQAFLNSSFSSSFPLVVPNEFLAVGHTYTFQTKLCNFLGACSQSIQVVEIIADFLPVVSIAGSSNLSMTNSQPLQLLSLVNARDCFGKAVSVSYEWKVIKQGSNLNFQSTSKNPARFHLPAYAFHEVGSYEVSLMVRAMKNVSARASVVVNVVVGKVVALIQGNNVRSMRVGQTLVLDASGSYDEDNKPDSTSPSLIFQWTCEQTFPLANKSCASVLNIIGAENEGKIKFTTKEADIKIIWTALVQDTQRVRNSSASVLVQVLPQQYPVITLQSNAEGDIVNPGRSLQLTAVIDIPDSLSGNASWSQTGGDSIALNSISLTALSQSISSSSSSRLLNMYLVLPPHTLTSGMSYSFALQTQLGGEGSSHVRVSSSISISVNTPPLPGVFLVQPSVGRAYVDSFMLSCSLWFDSNLPLSYQFSYWIEANDMKSVMRALSTVASISSLLPAGSEASNSSLVVIADVYDSLNANTTIKNSARVLPLDQKTFNVSNFIVKATSSFNTVDDLVQGTSLSSSILNQVNCSLAPNCLKLNRKPCFSTAHTCGSCLSAGQIGDSNNFCRSTNSTVKIVDTELQQCGGNCSGHGHCQFLSVFDNSDISSCYQGDVSCYAKCVCDEGFAHSAICDKSDAEVEDRTKSREQVLLGLQQIIGQQDPTETNIASWISSMLHVSQNPYELRGDSISSLLDMAEVALSAVKSSESSLVSSLSNLVGSIDSLCDATIIAQSLPSTLSSSADLTQRIVENLQNYSSLLVGEMAPGQLPSVAIQNNFKLYTASLVSDSQERSRRMLLGSANEQSCSQSFNLTLPQSTLEQELQLTSSSINIPNCGNDSSLSFIPISILSLTSTLFNQSTFMSNPISLYIPVVPCTNFSSPSCSAEITVPTYAQVNQTTAGGRNSTISCIIGDYSTHFIECGQRGSYNVSCRGKAETIEASCPFTDFFPTCNGLEIDKAVDIGCKVVLHGAKNITCSCPLFPQTSSSSSSSSVGDHNVRKETCKVSYVSMLQSTTSNFKKTVLSAQGLDESTVSDSWEALVTLGTFVTAVIVAMLFSLYADKEREKKVQSEEQLKHHVKKAVLSRNRLSTDAASADSVTQLAEEALPEILLTSESLFKRIWKEVKKHHRWVAVIYYFSKKFPRILRVMSLATNVIIMLFMQSLTYALTNGDDGSCQRYVTETACLEPSSAYSTGGSMCYWTENANGVGGSCQYVQPDSSITVVVFVAIFSGLVSAPISLSLDWVIQNILAAPVTSDNDEKRESTVLAMAVPTDEMGRGSGRNMIVPAELVSITSSRSFKRRNNSVEQSDLRDSIEEQQQQIEEISSNELEKLCDQLKKHREKITNPQEIKEFEDVWGWDRTGRFVDVTEPGMSSMFNFSKLMKRNRSSSEDDGSQVKTVKDVLKQELINLHRSILFEDAIQFGVNAGEVSKNKRLLYLFQKDLLPGLAGEILDGANRRDGKIEDDGRSLKAVSKPMKALGWLVLGAVDVGMLFYVFLFAASQDNHRQTAWGQSFAVWLILEVLLVSTSTVILMQIFLPALIMRDVMKIKEKLMDSIASYYENIEESSEVNDEVEESLQITQRDEKPFNAASYLFLSYRLAERYPDLKISKIILAFQTPWPRQSYQHVHDVKSEYTDSWTAVTRSFSVIIVFFLSNLLAVPLAVQDMIVQLVSTVTMGYTILLHLQLYGIFPALVIIPTMFVMGVGYYLMRSHVKAEQAEKEKIRDRLTSRKSKIGSMRDNIASMKMKKYEERKSQGEYNDSHRVASITHVASVIPLTESPRASDKSHSKHVNRRRSVQEGLSHLKQMQKEIESIKEGKRDDCQIIKKNQIILIEEDEEELDGLYEIDDSCDEELSFILSSEESMEKSIDINGKKDQLRKRSLSLGEGVHSTNKVIFIHRNEEVIINLPITQPNDVRTRHYSLDSSSLLESHASLFSDDII